MLDNDTKIVYDKDFDYQLEKHDVTQFAIFVQNENGHWLFENLGEARKMFPTIDPEINGHDFTSGMFGGLIESTRQPVMRFESWATYEALSR